jgi:hypothetical protein
MQHNNVYTRVYGQTLFTNFMLKCLSLRFDTLL